MSQTEDWSANDRAAYWEERAEQMMGMMRKQIEELEWKVADLERELRWLKNDMRR